MGHQEEMTIEMADAIVEILRDEMAYGWSLAQLKPLFEEAKKRAFEEIERM